MDIFIVNIKYIYNHIILVKAYELFETTWQTDTNRYRQARKKKSRGNAECEEQTGNLPIRKKCV